jgi:type 2 lantibiotic biosynthesis protein LanM
MVSFSDELLRIIARAASPLERASGAWFDPLPDQSPALIEQRAAQWINTVTGGDKELFVEYLKARGLTSDDFARAISDGAVKQGAELPGWAALFLELMESFAASADEAARTAAQFSKDGSSNAFDDLLIPFLVIGARELRKKISGLSVSVSDRAETQMLRLLGARLAGATIHVADNEIQTLHAASGFLKQMGFAAHQHLDGTLSGWMARFNHYPVLARIISVVFKNWRNFIHQMLDRLAGDQALLEASMFAGGSLGTLDNFIGDAGDLHDQGSAVALLIFDNGNRLAYKPKDLRISAAFLDLVALLNRSGLETPLHVRKIIPRGKYAWEEWVEHSPCRSEQDVERFYFRMGSMIRLLQLLGARDFWLDNLIACRDHPVFIDLEMAFQQTMELPFKLLPAEQIAFTKLQETAVPMGVIAMGTPIGQGIKAEDLGALTPVREFQTPFKFSYSTPMRALLAPHLKKNDNTRWQKTDYTPVLDGRAALAADHIEGLLAGYRAMDSCLRSNKALLLSDDGPFSEIKDFPIRHIHRDTWTCLRIINDSTRTPLLVDGFNRELFFEGLMRVAVEGGRPDAKLIKVIESEIESLLDLDVPLFRALPGEATILLSNGGEIPDYFYRTSLSQVIERVKRLDDFRLDEQIDFIRSDFANGLHKAPWPQSANGRPARPTPPREFWLEEAIKLGDFILAEGLASPEGDLAWLGLTYHPDVDLRSMDVLRPDLLTGTCGLSVLFADLYEMTRMTRFRDAARGALASTEHAIKVRHPLLRLLDRSATSGPRFIACGAYYGVGSQVYALRRCAEALDAADLDSSVAAYIKMLLADNLCENSHVDLIYGLAGLLLCVLPFQGKAMDEPALQVASVVANHLLGACENGASRLTSHYPPDAALLEGLPDILTGLALAFARLKQTAGARSLDSLRERIVPAIASLQALTPEDVSTGPSMWATLTVRHGCGQPVDDLLDRARRLTSSGLSSLASERLLDLLEISLTAFRITNDKQFYGRAVAVAEELLHRRDSTGSWFPASFAVDRHNLSAFHGVGAIAGYFISLYRAERIRSIRLLE